MSKLIYYWSWTFIPSVLIVITDVTTIAWLPKIAAINLIALYCYWYLNTRPNKTK